MSLIACNDSDSFNETELNHNEVLVNKPKDQLIKNKQYVNQCEQELYNDVYTSSYVRGYN